jgi:uncharacterized protein YdeI (YjbR/CyaY-like superfamily)
MKNLLYVSNRKDWRKWLARNHLKEKEIWLVYYKKHTGKDRVPYDDAVEEALCFGWVDSIVNRMDEDRYAQKFTPRKDNSKWSELNKKRVAKLEQLGLMTAHGTRKVEIAKQNGKWDEVIERPVFDEIHPDFQIALDQNPDAKSNFANLAQTYKKHYIMWISTAKKIETRQKRITEAIALLSKNQKLGLK